MSHPHASSSALLARRLPRAWRALGLPLAAVTLQLAGGACSHRSADAPPEAAPVVTPADRPHDPPACGCKTPCASHVEKAPCACKKGEPRATES